jgi:hypothetical protein
MLIGNKTACDNDRLTSDQPLLYMVGALSHKPFVPPEVKRLNFVLLRFIATWAMTLTMRSTTFECRGGFDPAFEAPVLQGQPWPWSRRSALLCLYRFIVDLANSGLPCAPSRFQLRVKNRLLESSC